MGKHVVIAGAGVIGLSVAYWCAQRGHRVTVVERGDAQRNGCSFGNAGMVVPSHFIPLAAPGMVLKGLKWMWNPESPFYVKPRLSRELLSWGWNFWRAARPARVRAAAPVLRDLHLASRELFEAMAAQGMDFGWEKRGLLMLCKTQPALDEEAHTAALATGLGVPARVLDARETAALDPGVTMDILGAVYFPRDCHLRPEMFLQAMESRICAAGGSFAWNTEITGCRRNGSQLAALESTRGEIAGDEFVLCTGAWSPSIARRLGLRLPVQAGKGYSLTLTRPVERPEICSILAEARVAVTPMGRGLRFGGTMEIAGLNETITRRRVQGIINSVSAYYPKFQPGHFAGIQPWRGLRPCPPDGMPYIGRTGAAPNLTIATGHGMMGLSLAPITGELVAKIIDGDPPGFDLTLCRPDRYA